MNDSRPAAPRPAKVQYLGIPGSTSDCVAAVAQIIQAGPPIESARIITAPEDSHLVHAFLLTCGPGDQVIVPSGFASGYAGEGPNGFSFVLALLESLKISVSEVHVPADVLERMDQFALTEEDLESIVQARPVRRSERYAYIDERDEQAISDGTLWERLEPFVPLAVIDPRIADLGRTLWEKPRENLRSAYLRLEDDVREKAGLTKWGSRLFADAFNGSGSKLTWAGLEESECRGRANIFTGVCMAFRGPSAHSEKLELSSVEALNQFLAVNLLFRLLRTSIRRDESP